MLQKSGIHIGIFSWSGSPEDPHARFRNNFFCSQYTVSSTSEDMAERITLRCLNFVIIIEKRGCYCHFKNGNSIVKKFSEKGSFVGQIKVKVFEK